MNVQQFRQKVYEVSGFNHAIVNHVLNTALDVMADTIASGEDLALQNFGKFSSRVVTARKMHTIHGEEKTVPSYRKIKFSPSVALRKEANKPR